MIYFVKNDPFCRKEFLLYRILWFIGLTDHKFRNVITKVLWYSFIFCILYTYVHLAINIVIKYQYYLQKWELTIPLVICFYASLIIYIIMYRKRQEITEIIVTIQANNRVFKTLWQNIRTIFALSINITNLILRATKIGDPAIYKRYTFDIEMNVNLKKIISLILIILYILI